MTPLAHFVTMPATTVVITSHNYGRYLAECIDSVLNQTRPAARLIVIDDASDDHTVKVVEPYRGVIDYFRVEFSSAQRSRNFATKLITTEFVLFLDADDRLEETAVERFEDSLQSHPGTRIAYCDKAVFGDADAMRNLGLNSTWKAPDFSLDLLRFRNFIMLSSMIRSEYLRDFDERINRLQDWDLWLNIIQKDDQAVHIPHPLLHYRVHGTNLSIRQRELIERLKIMLKHGLLDTKPGSCGARSRPALIVTIGRLSASWADLRLVKQQLGTEIKVIAGMPADQAPAEPLQRRGGITVQTVPDADLEQILWRCTGAVTDDRFDFVVFAPDFDTLVKTRPTMANLVSASAQALEPDRALQCRRLEELGVFLLPTPAVRRLLYLPPAPKLSALKRWQRAVSEVFDRHVGWRLRRAPADAR